MSKTHTRRYAPNRIKELRQRSRLSLEALGAAMPSDLTASTVAKLENQRMALSADYLLELAAIFGVTPSDILIDPKDGQVRMIPLIAERRAADREVGGVELYEEYIAVPGQLDKPGLFAIKPTVGAAGSLIQTDGFVVVDPGERALINNKWYTITVDGEVRYCRYDAEPTPRLTNARDDSCTAIGAEPFVVLGRIIYIGQEM